MWPGGVWAGGQALPLIPDKTKKKHVQAVGRHKFPTAFSFACFSMNNPLLVPLFQAGRASSQHRTAAEGTWDGSAITFQTAPSASRSSVCRELLIARSPTASQRLLRHCRHQLGFLHVPTLNSSFHPTLQPSLLKATLNHPRQSLQTGRCGNQELIYFIGLCSLITTCDHTAFRFDQSSEPADLLLHFQCGHHGFQLEKKPISATWVILAHERLKGVK